MTDIVQVTQPFLGYATGATISDPGQVLIAETSYPNCVVRISTGGTGTVAPVVVPQVAVQQNGQSAYRTLGAGFAFSSDGNTLMAGGGLPLAAPLLASNATGTATPVVLGAGLQSNNGTLSSTGTASTVGAGTDVSTTVVTVAGMPAGLASPALAKVHYRARNVIDHFGADPTGATPSDTAFGEFHAALIGSQSGNQSGGGGLWVPQGNYLLNNPFVITNSFIKLHGDGEGVTFIKGADSNAGPVIQIGASDGGQAYNFSPTSHTMVEGHRNEGFTVGRATPSSYTAGHQALGTVAVGSITGSTLTVTAIIDVSSGIAVGQAIDSGGVIGGTTIASQLSGTTGGVGTYSLTTPGGISQYVTPENMVIGGAVGIRWAYFNDGKDRDVQITDQFIGRRLDCVSGPNAGMAFTGSLAPTAGSNPATGVLTINSVQSGYVFGGEQVVYNGTPVCTIVSPISGTNTNGTFNVVPAYGYTTIPSVPANSALTALGIAHEISIRYDCLAGHVKSCVAAYEWLARVADVFFTGMEYGQNSADTYSPEIGPLVLNDVAQEMRFDHCLFIPRGPNNSRAGYNTALITCLNWKGYPQEGGEFDGMIELTDGYSEGINYGIQSDALTPAVCGLTISGGQYGFTKDFMNLNPATNGQDVQVSGTTMNGPFNLENCFETTVNGCVLRGGATIVGSVAGDATNYSDCNFTGNIVENGLSFSGAFLYRTFVGITLRSGAFSDTATVTYDLVRGNSPRFVIPDSPLDNVSLVATGALALGSYEVTASSGGTITVPANTSVLGIRGGALASQTIVLPPKPAPTQIFIIELEAGTSIGGIGFATSDGTGFTQMPSSMLLGETAHLRFRGLDNGWYGMGVLRQPGTPVPLVNVEMPSTSNPGTVVVTSGPSAGTTYYASSYSGEPLFCINARGTSASGTLEATGQGTGLPIWSNNGGTNAIFRLADGVLVQT